MNPNLIVSSTVSLQQAMDQMERLGEGFLAVVNKDQQLLGILTDGGIRRGIIYGKQHLQEFVDANPVTIAEDATQAQAIGLLKRLHKRHLPVVDETGKLVDLFVLEEHERPVRPNKVVIMAGGLGSRLGQLTRDIPKPMLPLGNKPILEIIVDSFVEYGYTDILISLKYKSSVIKDYFGDGSDFGAKISYVEEEKWLGTAGALSLIDSPMTAPFFVMNGDILTTLNFDSLLQFHLEKEAMATMCLHEHTYNLPFGVVSTRNSRILSLEEKPTKSFYVNAGIYVLNPQLISLIPYNSFYHITTLFEEMISQEQSAHAYIINEFWMDIGRVEDYTQAQATFSLKQS